MSSTDVLKFLMNNWVTLFVGLLGLVASVILYQRGRRKRDPRWDIRTTIVIQDYSAKLTDLGVTYAGKPVQTLSVSRVMFWNNGNETLNASDLVSVDPLRLVTTDGVQILNATLLASNNVAAQLQIQAAPNSDQAIVTFDYLDGGQGGVFQIVHTGKRRNLHIEGTIKGVRSVRRERLGYIVPPSFSGAAVRNWSPRKRMLFTMGLIVAQLVLLVLTAVLFLIALSMPQQNPPSGPLVTYGVLLVLLVLAIPFMYLLSRTVRAFRLIGRGTLDAFDDDPLR
jgi:hypothetical protein